MSYDVFISHSSKDKPYADAICAGLEAKGIRCWIAPRDVLPGVEWTKAIVDAITNCKVYLLILSTNSNQSPQAIKELDCAVNHQKPIIPFRIDEVTPTGSMEYYLGGLHWLDAITRPVEQHISTLGDYVKKIVDATNTITDLSSAEKTVENTDKDFQPNDESKNHSLKNAKGQKKVGRGVGILVGTCLVVIVGALITIGILLSKDANQSITTNVNTANLSSKCLPFDFSSVNWIEVNVKGTTQFIKNNGVLEIAVKGGEQDQYYPVNTDAPKYLRDVSSDNFSILTHVSLENFDSSTGYMGAGLVVYVDPSTYAWFALTPISGIGQSVVFQGNSYSFFDSDPVVSSGSEYLILNKVGNKIAAGFSQDGNTFTWSAPVNFDVSNAKVGVIVISAWNSSGITGKFDCFNYTPGD